LRTEPPELPRDRDDEEERDGADRDGADLEPEEIRAEEREPEEGADRIRLEDELALGAENTERGEELENERSGE